MVVAERKIVNCFYRFTNHEVGQTFEGTNRFSTSKSLTKFPYQILRTAGFGGRLQWRCACLPDLRSTQPTVGALN